MLRAVKLLLICAPLALAACSSGPSNEELQTQINAANQKAEQALTTAQEALSAAQAANAQGSRAYNRSLQK